MARTITAKFDGTCCYCGTPTREGEKVRWERGEGVWHPNCAPSGDSTADREYWAGRADGERHRVEREVYGEEMAERFEAEREFTAFWKHGEDY